MGDRLLELVQHGRRLGGWEGVCRPGDGEAGRGWAVADWELCSALLCSALLGLVLVAARCIQYGSSPRPCPTPSSPSGSAPLCRSALVTFYQFIILPMLSPLS